MAFAVVRLAGLACALQSPRLLRVPLARRGVAAGAVGGGPAETRVESWIEDDGFALAKHKKRVSQWRKRLVGRQPGTLILVRHGESLWNENSTFTGWADVDLSARGEREVEHAARLLLEAGYDVDVAYTSRLRRAIRSCWILLRGLDQVYRPVFKSWRRLGGAERKKDDGDERTRHYERRVARESSARGSLTVAPPCRRLNERHYGALTGLSKPGLAAELGEDVVQAFRHGLHDTPPPMDGGHAYSDVGARKYGDLREVPSTESLQSCMVRTLPLWDDKIKPDLLAGRTVMVVAHGNSLRGLVKHIDGVSDGDISRVSIPNGIPLVYKFERSRGADLVVAPAESADGGGVLRGEFLEKKGLLRAALAAEADLKRRIPGSDAREDTFSVRALKKLELGAGNGRFDVAST